MTADRSRSQSRLTLVLCTGLHTFTHAFQTLLIPLYLLIVADFHLNGVKAVALVVAAYNVVYTLFSYPAGVIADRANRKLLLGWGLIVNSIAILLMGWADHYWMLLALSVFAGLAGTIFHPAANALATAHYPRSPGSAIGIMGMGAGMGFFTGPRFAGWRAQSVSWHRPLVEAGLAGLAFGAIFLLLAREARGATPAGAQSNAQPARTDDSAEALKPAREQMGRQLRVRMLIVSLTLWMRDFAGIAVTTLSSVYLQNALRQDVNQTGRILGSMMLIAIVINPLIVLLTPGRRRLPMLAIVLFIAGAVLASVPYWPVGKVLPVLCVFQAFHLGSYSVSESAILERISPAVRGRVIGMFLTIGGTLGATAPWVMGAWTDQMGPRAFHQASYVPIFSVLAVMMAAASISIPFIARLGPTPEKQVIDPMSEVSPATMEPGF